MSSVRSMRYAEAESPRSQRSMQFAEEHSGVASASSLPYVHYGGARAGAPTPVSPGGGGCGTPRIVTDTTRSGRPQRSLHSMHSLQQTTVSPQASPQTVHSDRVLLDAAGPFPNDFGRRSTPPHSVSMFNEIEGPRLHVNDEDPLGMRGLLGGGSADSAQYSTLSFEHSERVVVDAGLPPSRSSTPQVMTPLDVSISAVPVLSTPQLTVPASAPSMPAVTRSSQSQCLSTHFVTPPASPMVDATLRSETPPVAPPGGDYLSDTLWSFADKANVPSVLNSELMASAGFIKEEDMNNQCDEPPAEPEQKCYRAVSYPACWSDDELNIGRLESTFLQQQENLMDHQLAMFERIAANVVTEPDSLDDWDPNEEPAWRAGTRDFRSKYTLEPLSGFYIDKTRIAQREEFLTRLNKDHQHLFFDWLAGVPVEKRKKRREAIQGMAWRGHSSFEQVDDDDLVFRGGGKDHRSFAPPPEQVLTF